MHKKFTDINAYLIESINLYNIDLPAREIFLVGECDPLLEDNYKKLDGLEPGIEYIMASRIIKNLRLLDTISNEPILVHMKTCGGCWQEGMAIYDMVRFCKSPITILNYTHARSMSSLVFQAADYRVMMPNSYFLYHHGSYGVWGDWTKVQSIIDWDRKIPDTMLNIYAERMITTEGSRYFNKKIDLPKKFLRKHMADKIDCFLTPDQTIELGLADAIFDGDWDGLKSF